VVSNKIAKNQVFAHRGLWKKSGTQGNSQDAIVSALRDGFSLETDVRDSNRRIVVSHDPAQHESTFLTLDFLLDELEASESGEHMIALNVKADGLVIIAGEVLEKITALKERLYFFDMSIPETLRFSRASLPFALRASEYEPISDIEGAVWPSIPTAVWVDGFHGDWFLENDGDSILRLAENQLVTIVSPELHGRDSARFEAWFLAHAVGNENLSVCTDFPERFLS
jgi:hypothetical protein